MLKWSLPFWDHISHLSKIFLTTSSIWWNCAKIDFLYPCMLTLTIMISEMGVNCLSCNLLSQQKRDLIIGFTFDSLNQKQQTDIFHRLPTFTFFVLFELINGTFFESCFCWARGKYKKQIQLNLEVVTFKVDDVIRKILFSWWMLFKSFNNSSLKLVSFVLIKRFWFQHLWKITLSHFYIFFSFFFTWH